MRAVPFRELSMFFHKTFILFSVLLIFSCTALPVHTAFGDSSVLIGRLKGTLHEPPRPFLGNSPQVGGSRGSVEFKGFKLIGRDNGKKTSIRPLGSGFFRKKLPPGEYDLVRERNDRPSHKENKLIKILAFTVPENSLVNLGTLEIILEGPPDKSRMRRGSRYPRGTYTYHYRYERTTGADAMRAPFERYFGENPGAAAEYTGGIVEVTNAPTDAMDSSELTLRERYFRTISY